MAKKRSLREYVGERTRGARLKQCPVCRLPPAVLEQIAQRGHRVRIVDAMAWLSEEYGIKITEEQFNVHRRGNHGSRT